MNTKVIKFKQEDNLTSFQLTDSQAELIIPILKNVKCTEYLQIFFEESEAISDTLDELLIGHDWDVLGGTGEKLAYSQIVSRLLQKARLLQVLNSITPKLSDNEK
ncbi:MAG: hypothetical protein KDC85_12940 [Saprospiraceae bacterium]|nr:hypothetical protein [Saprospiraceae bacterium]MCB9323999.1 hypothetical protein [Lewinellaceae bacterium]